MAEANNDSESAKEIKLLREETAKQYKSSMLFAGYAMGFAVVLLGVTVWVQVYASIAWQKVDACFFILTGILTVWYMGSKHMALMKATVEKQAPTSSYLGVFSCSTTPIYRSWGLFCYYSYNQPETACQIPSVGTEPEKEPTYAEMEQRMMERERRQENRNHGLWLFTLGLAVVSISIAFSTLSASKIQVTHLSAVGLVLGFLILVVGLFTFITSHEG